MERHRRMTARTLPALRRMMRRLAQPRHPDADAPSGPHADDRAVSARLDALETQVRHMEAALEGLQDAMHRRSLLDDERNDELQRRTHPAQMARDLSDDARKRGL